MAEFEQVRAKLLSAGAVELVEARVSHQADDNAGFYRVFGDGAVPLETPARLSDSTSTSDALVVVLVEVEEFTSPLRYLLRLLTGGHSRASTLVIGSKYVRIDGTGFASWVFPLMSAEPLIAPSLFDPDCPLFEMQLVAADEGGRLIHPKWEQDLSPFIGAPNIDRYLPLSLRYAALVIP